MKKVFLTLALVFATSTVLVSCGGESTDDAASTENTDDSASNDDADVTTGDASPDASGE